MNRVLQEVKLAAYEAPRVYFARLSFTGRPRGTCTAAGAMKR